MRTHHPKPCSGRRQLGSRFYPASVQKPHSLFCHGGGLPNSSSSGLFRLDNPYENAYAGSARARLLTSVFSQSFCIQIKEVNICVRRFLIICLNRELLLLSLLNRLPGKMVAKNPSSSISSKKFRISLKMKHPEKQ